MHAAIKAVPEKTAGESEVDPLVRLCRQCVQCDEKWQGPQILRHGYERAFIDQFGKDCNPEEGERCRDGRLQK